MDNIKENNKLIAEFMGYIYFEPNVLIDNSECGGIYDATDVYSKVPIEVNDSPPDNANEDYQKYFKDLPNPDFGNEKSTRWRSDFEELSWATLNWDQYITHLEYHSSWDWLMPVVEKIIKQHHTDFYIDHMTHNYFSAGLGSDGRYYQYESNDKPINLVYKCVVEFIKWYNSNKNI